MTHWSAEDFAAGAKWLYSCPFWMMLCFAAIGGALVYLVVRIFKGGVHAIAAGDAGACAAGIYAGLHLSYGAIVPKCIVHLEDIRGSVIDLAALTVVGINPQPTLDFAFGDIHRIHILLGGIITAVASAGGLWRYCTEPAIQQAAHQEAQVPPPHHPSAAPKKQPKKNPKRKNKKGGRR